MKLLPRLLAALLALVSVGAAAKSYEDGNTLLARLQSEQISERMFGIAYIVGVADSLDGQHQGAVKTCFAVPANASAGQIRDIVKQYLEQHPAGRHYAGHWLVSVALESAFPCK